jgi:two-component system, NarL family, sensor kinase
VRNLLLPGQETADTLLNELSTDIEGAIADIRRIVYDLRPPSLEELGLVGAMRARCGGYMEYSPSNLMVYLLSYVVL